MHLHTPAAAAGPAAAGSAAAGPAAVSVCIKESS